MTENPENHTEIVKHRRIRAFDGFLSIVEFDFQHRKFDGTMSEILTRQVMNRGDAVAILPFDAVRDEVVLIRQVLAGNIEANVPERPLQVIAGMVGFNEFDTEVAVREAEEEAGVKISELRHAHRFMPSPGGSSERVATFVGRADLSLAGGIHGLSAEHEDIRVEVVSAREAIRLLDSGEIEAGPAVVLLSWFARHHAMLRYEWLYSRG